MPPPGFGPKIDKKKQQEEVNVIPPSERYSIRLEGRYEETLRSVLAAAQEHTAPSSQRLLRDSKKLHQLYSQLLRLGFSAESIEQCLPRVRTGWAVADALDWCCLHLSEAVLPAAFKLSRIGEARGGGRRRRRRGGGKAASGRPRAHGKVAEREAARRRRRRGRRRRRARAGGGKERRGVWAKRLRQRCSRRLIGGGAHRPLGV